MFVLKRICLSTGLYKREAVPRAMANEPNPYNQTPQMHGSGQPPPPGQYPAFGQYPVSGQYPISGQHPAPGQYQMPGQMPYPPPGQAPIQYFNQAYCPQANIPMQQEHGSDYGYGYGYGSMEENKRHHTKDRIKHVDTYQLFSDASIRRAFIQKVYSMLTLQLLITTGFILVFILVEPVKHWVQKDRIVIYIAL